MKRVASVALLVVLAVTLLAGATPQEAASASIQGTVQTAESKRGTLDVMTGVGMSLRIVRLTVPPSVRIASGGARSPLSALKPTRRSPNRRAGSWA